MCRKFGITNIVVCISIHSNCSKVGGNLVLYGAEQGEEIKAQRLTYFNKAFGLHRLPLQDAVNVLLGYTYPASKLGFAYSQLYAALFYRFTHMYMFNIYIHIVKPIFYRYKQKSLNKYLAA